MADWRDAAVILAQLLLFSPFVCSESFVIHWFSFSFSIFQYYFLHLRLGHISAFRTDGRRRLSIKWGTCRQDTTGSKNRETLSLFTFSSVWRDDAWWRLCGSDEGKMLLLLLYNNERVGRDKERGTEVDYHKEATTTATSMWWRWSLVSSQLFLPLNSFSRRKRRGMTERKKNHLFLSSFPSMDGWMFLMMPFLSSPCSALVWPSSWVIIRILAHIHPRKQQKERKKEKGIPFHSSLAVFLSFSLVSCLQVFFPHLFLYAIFPSIPDTSQRTRFLLVLPIWKRRRRISVTRNRDLCPKREMMEERKKTKESWYSRRDIAFRCIFHLAPSLSHNPSISIDVHSWSISACMWESGEAWRVDDW